MLASIRALAPVLVLALAFGAAASEESVPAAEAAPAEAAAPTPEAAPTESAPAAPEEAAAPAEPAASAEAASADESGAAERAAEEVADAAQEPSSGAEAAQSAPREKHAVSLGPVGYDAAGQPGRVHTVAGGDTLWDVSDAYLGTPWVWPSIWYENESVDNPHLILPGDKLWVTPTVIRRVTDAEAEALLAGAPAEGGPASMDGVAVTYADAPASGPRTPTVRYAWRESVGLVSGEALDGAASLVDSPQERTWLGSMDPVNVGLGAGEVEAGDQFLVFRAKERVFDPDDGQPLGWHVNVLGWLEIVEVNDETSLAVVRMAFSEMRLGDRLWPRELLPHEIELRASPPGVDGRIVLLADKRMSNGDNDVVFLNRGRADGLEVGSTLEVYRPVGKVRDPARVEKGLIFERTAEVKVPARVVATLVVVRTFDESAAAIVHDASTELGIGDLVRATDVQISSR
jgi:hypothetical protein